MLSRSSGQNLSILMLTKSVRILALQASFCIYFEWMVIEKDGGFLRDSRTVYISILVSIIMFQCISVYALTRYSSIVAY